LAEINLQESAAVASVESDDALLGIDPLIAPRIQRGPRPGRWQRGTQALSTSQEHPRAQYPGLGTATSFGTTTIRASEPGLQAVPRRRHWVRCTECCRRVAVA